MTARSGCAQALVPAAEESEEPDELPRTLGAGTTRLLDEVDEYFHLGASVRRGDTVLDVGANVGAFALRAAQRAGSDLMLHCFEPSPPTFEALETNFTEQSRLRVSRHRLYRLALGGPENAGTEQTFFHFRRFPTDSTLDIAAKRLEFEHFFQAQGARFGARIERAVAGPLGRLFGRATARFIAWMPTGRLGGWMSDRVTGLTRTRCAVDTLSRLVHREGIARIDLLKVDVEGAEMDVLSGAAGVWPRVRAAVIETHDRAGRAHDMVELLGAQGFHHIRTARPRASVEAGLDNVIVYASR